MEIKDGLRRYSDSDRSNHWLVVLAFFVAALSGLAFFHPSLFFLTHLFGGGAWTRILHPFAGVIMFVLFLGMIMRFWQHNIIGANDKAWLRQWREVMNNREDKLPEVGRYNGGQKLLFWVMVACLFILLATGITFWYPYFRSYFSIGTIRAATLLHSVTAVVLVLGVVVHVYAGIWVRGTMHGMMRGTVAGRWARKHHLGWYKEETSQKG
jgi:formate dehydrogenase subunit gamma